MALIPLKAPLRAPRPDFFDTNLPCNVTLTGSNFLDNDAIYGGGVVLECAPSHIQRSTNPE